MNFLIASDSFKGTFSSMEIANITEKAILTHFPNASVTKLSIADGGEGTIETLLDELSLDKKEVTVHNPIGKLIKTYYGINENCAFIEMAKTSGLCLLSESEKSAQNTTTFGVGETILDALNAGAKNIYISLGGSATNDGGMGMMEALGVIFYDSNNNALNGIGSNLEKVCYIDLSNIDARVKDTTFTAICDVENTLTGKNGATFVYGKQKGATDSQIIELENGMVNYCNILEKTFNSKVSTIKGGGAAGGMGAAVNVYLDAQICKGIETVLDLIDFDKKVKQADIIIVGEGKIDAQSLFGKAIVGVSKRCLGKPVVAIVGTIGEGFEKVYDYGVHSVFSTYNDSMDLSQALQNAKPLLEQATDRMIRFIKVGHMLQ